jgi:hypothetical protein
MAKVTRLNVDKEFARQGTAPEHLPSEAQRDALAQLATGILRGSLGAPGIPQDKVREQIIAIVVWAYLYRQDPRDVHAAQMPKLIAQNFATRGEPTPAKDTVTALSEVAIGWVHEGRWPWPSMGRLLAAQAAVNNYLAGA